MTIPWITYINLPASMDRKESIERQFQCLNMGINPVRTEAIPSGQQTSLFDELTDKEYACLLSHRKAVESIPPEHVGLILEDDALISPGFKSRFAKLVEVLKDDKLSLTWDVMFLGHTPNFRRFSVLAEWIKDLQDFDRRTDNAAFGLLSCQRFEWGTFAYLVHPRAKAKILKAIDVNLSRSSALPIDNLIAGLIRSNQLRGLIVFPSLVGVDPKFSTTISDRKSLGEERYHAVAANFLVPGLDTGYLRSRFEGKPQAERTSDSNLESRIGLLADAVRDFILNVQASRPQA